MEIKNNLLDGLADLCLGLNVLLLALLECCKFYLSQCFTGFHPNL